MDTLSILHSETDNSCDCMMSKESDDAYIGFLISRYVTIGLSATALMILIGRIIKKKQIRFPTLKLFSFVVIFHTISLLSVMPHGPYFNQDAFFINLTISDNNQECFSSWMDELTKDTASSYGCAIEGFINLFSYSTSYWFAVLMSLYIKLAFQERHKKFMKTNWKTIVGVIAIIFVWYLVPAIATFKEGQPFSFGPTGYRYNGNIYLLYSGIVGRQQNVEWLVVFWMLALPISLFVYHMSLYLKNKEYARQRILNIVGFNNQDAFLIKASNSTVWIFTVQGLNVFKLLLGIIYGYQKDQSVFMWVVLIINILFDLLGFIMILIYIRYYKSLNREVNNAVQTLIEQNNN